MITSIVDYNETIDTPCELPPWSDSFPKPEQKKLDLEEKEKMIAVNYQIKMGLIKRKEQAKAIVLNSGEIGKCIVTPPVLTMLKGLDLYQDCFCGSGQLLINCHIKEALKRVR